MTKNYIPTVVKIEYINNKYNVRNLSNIEAGFSPLSGYEPTYDPDSWNMKQNIKNNHNCYSYAFNDINLKRQGKAQPGYFAHFPSIQNKEYNCKAIYKRIKRDNPAITKTTFNKKCPKGTYKAFVALDPEGDTDYHFYRQDKNGYWSHKPGRSNVVNVDASKKLIKNPVKANRNYGTYNYKIPCDFFCVKPDMSITKSNTLYYKS